MKWNYNKSKLIIHFSFWNRNEATIVDILLFLLSCCWFVVELLLLLRNLWLQGGLSGSPGTRPSSLVSYLGGIFVQSVFLHPFVVKKKDIHHEDDIKTESKIHSKPDLGHGFSDCLHTLFLNDNSKFLLYFLGFSCSEKHKNTMKTKL